MCLLEYGSTPAVGSSSMIICNQVSNKLEIRKYLVKMLQVTSLKKIVTNAIGIKYLEKWV